MPLLNDVARCVGGEELLPTGTYAPCYRRETCARYVERNQGGPRTMTYEYLCSDGDMYIPVEKPDDY